MISNRIVAIAICATMGIATATQSDLAFAKNKNASQTSETANNGVKNDSYPNGRPWLAMESDFTEVKYRIAAVKKDTESILHKLGKISDDISALKNTLDVQVSVQPASDEQRNDVNDAPVHLFVQVTRNGVGVSGLSADDFGYTNSFPLNDASYCGNACFIAGENGLYALELQGDWVEASYAGTLNVQFTTSTKDSDVTSTGTSLVTFDIPAAPAP